jgi:hypothetical protein
MTSGVAPSISLIPKSAVFVPVVELLPIAERCSRTDDPRVTVRVETSYCLDIVQSHTPGPGGLTDAFHRARDADDIEAHLLLDASGTGVDGRGTDALVSG